LPDDDAEARVLSVLLTDWPDSIEVVERLPLEFFTHPAAKEILTVLKGLAPQPGTLDFSSLTTHLGADAGRLAAQLLLREDKPKAESAAGKGSERLSRIQIPLMQLKIRLLEETAQNLQPEIQSAAAAGNVERHAEAYRRKRALVKEIQHLKAELKAETARRF
jgi:hypothetical protein